MAARTCTRDRDQHACARLLSGGAPQSPRATARSAESIAATIVEGCGADSNKEFARFLEMSIKSANETEHHLISARDYDLISPDDWHKYTAETIEVRKMTYGYRKKVLQNKRDG